VLRPVLIWRRLELVARSRRQAITPSAPTPLCSRTALAGLAITGASPLLRLCAQPGPAGCVGGSGSSSTHRLANLAGRGLARQRHRRVLAVPALDHELLAGGWSFVCLQLLGFEPAVWRWLAIAITLVPP